MKFRIHTHSDNNKTVLLAWLLIFIISIVLFGILTATVLNGITLASDRAALLWINEHATSMLDVLFVAITELGGVFVITGATVVFLVYFLRKKRYHQALFTALSVGGAALLNLIMKAVFERPRPDLWEWIIIETSFSFPSGHAMASSALALTIIVLVWKTKWRVAAVVLAAVYLLVVGVSRLYLGVHYPTDIIGGWLLGAAWVALVVIVMQIYTFYHAKKRRFLL